MSGRPPAGHTVPGRCAAAAAELGVPVPFDLEEFCARLERRCGRAVRLVPWDMARTAASGFLCKTARADYLYYEEHTSPFHQAHIVLTLAAQLLLAEEGTASFSHSLVSEIGPELSELMLDRTADAPVSRMETEMFAFLVLERARRGHTLGLSGDECAAAIEAAVLTAAAHARRTGQQPLNKVCTAEDPSWLRADLGSEAAWLVKVARALAAPPLVPAPSRGCPRDRSAHRGVVRPA